MPSGYSYVLSETASEFAFRLPHSEQKRLAYACRQLAQKPFSVGDYAVTDSVGRSVQNLLLDDWVFSYWADYAHKELRITDVVQV
ncbi:MAG: hypothetical protein WDM96_04510 [Lacunisphaera sp.]